jgi:magnesium-transporting ATPase (P-type)
VLAVCHTAIPVADKNSAGMPYEAESPDEGALVTAAREFGFEFYHRTQTTLSVHEYDPVSGGKVDRCLSFPLFLVITLQNGQDGLVHDALFSFQNL